MVQTLWLCASLITFSYSAVSAQSSLQDIKPGTPIRLFEASGSHHVDWIQLKSDSFAVVSENQRLRQLSVTSIDSIFCFSRRGTDAAWKAAVLGAAAGALLFPMAADCEGSANCTKTRLKAGLLGAGVGGAIFGVVGAVVGTITSGHRP